MQNGTFAALDLLQSSAGGFCVLQRFPDASAAFVSADSEVIYRNSDGHVIKFNILTNETEVILMNTTFVSGRRPAGLHEAAPTCSQNSSSLFPGEL